MGKEEIINYLCKSEKKGIMLQNYAEIAEGTGVNVNTASRLLRKMRECNEIKYKTTRDGGKKKYYRYYL